VSCQAMLARIVSVLVADMMILISWACAILQPAGYLQGPIQEGQQHSRKFPLLPSDLNHMFMCYTATVYWVSSDQFIPLKKKVASLK